MDVIAFSKMLNDKHAFDYEKLKYKFGDDFEPFLNDLREIYYTDLPLYDFSGDNIVYIDKQFSLKQNTTKLLLKEQESPYGVGAAENEIISSQSIENIDLNRDSVRRILRGFAPRDKQEERILGLRNGLDFIADPNNAINEDNIGKLYKMTVGDYLEEDERLPEGYLYRNDTVYIVSDRIEHAGLDHKKLPSYMKQLIDFINEDDGMNDLVKAAVIHFYIAFLHPYFDGNGRIARLLHLWFLIRQGYRSALFIPFSSLIEKSRKAYYDAFTAVENNKKYSSVIDVTPFIAYIVNNVYNKMNEESPDAGITELYRTALKNGEITKKEACLWKFVLSCYGVSEFSTKQLEKDFGDAAYATIRAFVLKFEKSGLLTSVRYGSRVRYKVSTMQG